MFRSSVSRYISMVMTALWWRVQMWSYVWSQVSVRLLLRSRLRPSFVQTFVTMSSHFCFHTATALASISRLTSALLMRTGNLECELQWFICAVEQMLLHYRTSNILPLGQLTENIWIYISRIKTTEWIYELYILLSLLSWTGADCHVSGFVCTSNCRWWRGDAVW